MAKKPDVQLSSTRLDALILPPNFSRAYQLYVLQQAADLGALAGQANSASNDAKTAQEQNAAQDEKISEQGQQLETVRGDYVSKTAAEPQSVTSSFSASSFLVNGVQVVGSRVTGITAATGTAYRGAFDANKSYDAASVLVGLVEARQRIKTLEDALRQHGLIA